MRFLIFLAVMIFIALGAKANAGFIGEVKTKGMIFKDKLQVHSFNDPDIKGITCYTTRQKRALSFVDSSNTSIACRKTGEIVGKLVSKKNVFRTDKSMLILPKDTVVDRMYDEVNGVLIYLTYTKSLGGKNTSHSISVVVVR